MPRYRNVDEHHRALTNARTLTNVIERVGRCQALASVIKRVELYRDALAKTIRT